MWDLSTDAETFLAFLGLFALGCLIACLLTPTEPRR
jgi:hypothetical protein